MTLEVSQIHNLLMIRYHVSFAYLQGYAFIGRVCHKVMIPIMSTAIITMVSMHSKAPASLPPPSRRELRRSMARISLRRLHQARCRSEGIQVLEGQSRIACLRQGSSYFYIQLLTDLNSEPTCLVRAGIVH
jgi:hypothetical protein